MSRITQVEAVKGSQWCLQVTVNRFRDVIDKKLRASLGLDVNDTIEWLSPLMHDSYAEYQDKEFLDLLSVHLKDRSLESFWPRNGAVWDGLAKTDKGDIILVEAKSHISELKSSCKACPESMDSIKDSIKETAGFYKSDSPDNWLDGYYQYANRLAHLYLLRQLNGIPAWLVFVYFVNDYTVAGPESVKEWQPAIADIHKHLGIDTERLGPYVVDVFIDIEGVIKDARNEDVRKAGLLAY